MSNAEQLIHNATISDAKAGEFAQALEASFDEGLNLEAPKASTLMLVARTIPAITLAAGGAFVVDTYGAAAAKDCTVTLKLAAQWGQTSHLTRKNAEGQSIYTPGVDTLGGPFPGLLFVVTQDDFVGVLKTDARGVGVNDDDNPLNKGIKNDEPFLRVHRAVDDRIEGLTLNLKRVGEKGRGKNLVIPCGQERTAEEYFMVSADQAARLPKNANVHAPRKDEKLLESATATPAAVKAEATRPAPVPTAPEAPKPAPTAPAKVETAPAKSAGAPAATTTPDAANHGFIDTVKAFPGNAWNFVKDNWMFVGGAVLVGAVGYVLARNYEKSVIKKQAQGAAAAAAAQISKPRSFWRRVLRVA